MASVAIGVEKGEMIDIDGVILTYTGEERIQRVPGEEYHRAIAFSGSGDKYAITWQVIEAELASVEHMQSFSERWNWSKFRAEKIEEEGKAGFKDDARFALFLAAYLIAILGTWYFMTPVICSWAG